MTFVRIGERIGIEGRGRGMGRLINAGSPELVNGEKIRNFSY